MAPAAPAVDITDTENAFELTAGLPGIEEKDNEVKVANGILSIKGEKQEEKEERKKGKKEKRLLSPRAKLRLVRALLRGAGRWGQ